VDSVTSGLLETKSTSGHPQAEGYVKFIECPKTTSLPLKTISDADETIEGIRDPKTRMRLLAEIRKVIGRLDRLIAKEHPKLPRTRFCACPSTACVTRSTTAIPQQSQALSTGKLRTEPFSARLVRRTGAELSRHIFPLDRIIYQAIPEVQCVTALVAVLPINFSCGPRPALLLSISQLDGGFIGWAC
jgi:hypothetical protein